MSQDGAQNGDRVGPVVAASAITTDVIAWLLATALATSARFDFDPHHVRWPPIGVLALFLAGGQCMVGGFVMTYRRRYQPGSFDEIRGLTVAASGVAALATVVVVIVQPQGIPRSLPFLAWPLALFTMCAVRGAKRLVHQAGARPNDRAERILVLGAGWLGSAIVQQTLGNPHSPFLPVGILDDDPTKRNFQLHGVRVRGRFDELEQVARSVEATRVVVAVNDADSALLRRVSDAADAAGLGCLVMPPLRDMLRSNQVKLSSLREIDVEDVIGRRPVETDVRAIANYVTGRRVLVTGAGGSIGSELCRQLHKFGPAELVMLDRDESALHAVELSIYGSALLESPEVVLCDIRERGELDRVFLEHQPEVVFHAAALKHLTLLERYPHEALKSNVYGTRNVLDVANRHGVVHFVNISTDKAADATSALGHSKRLAERLTAWYSTHGGGGKFLSVRFGNVLGSRGSVLHAFASQIERGGPVTVTDPAVTRFFMTIPEACQLVIQAGAIGRGGEALVLDMGEPVNILDVASRMIAMSGKADVEIVFTGLRGGEKMHEVLLGSGELGNSPFHPLISHVDVPVLDPRDIAEQPWAESALRRGSRESEQHSAV